MNWSNELPTEPGRYLWRVSEELDIGPDLIVIVFMGTDETGAARLYGQADIDPRRRAKDWPGPFLLEQVGGEWQGPIAPQEGADHE